MEDIKQILMRRDGMSAEEADELIADARKDFNERITNEDYSVIGMDDFCTEWFGLEPDFLIEFLV